LENTRDCKFDVIKGFTIILVVLGHVIQRNIVSYESNIAFLIIYSFHMPLFMYISGYITYGRVGFNKKEWLLNKFSILIIPFFSWMLLSYVLSFLTIFGIYPPYTIVSGGIIHYIAYTIIHPNNGLWFLWALFGIYIPFLFAQKLEIWFRDFAYLITAALLSVILIPPFSSYRFWFGLNYIQYYFVFFTAGYLIAKHQIDWIRVIKYFEIISLLLFPVLLFFWIKLYPLQSFIGHAVESNLAPLLALIYQYTLGFTGIFFVVYLFSHINYRSLNILAWLGTITLNIYAAHIPFLKLLHGNSIVSVITSTLTVLLLAIFVSYLISNVSPINKVFFGKDSKFELPRFYRRFNT